MNQTDTRWFRTDSTATFGNPKRPMTAASQLNSTFQRTKHYKDPAKRDFDIQSPFDRINELPKQKLKLLINKDVLRRDKQAAQNIRWRLEADKKEEAEVKRTQMRNRQIMLNRIRQNRQKKDLLDKQIGVNRPKSASVGFSFFSTQRINQLALPKKEECTRHAHHSDFNGLLQFRYDSAIRELKGIKNEAKTFSLETFNQTYDKASNYRSKEAQESIKIIQNFEARYGKYRKTIGFPNYLVETTKDPCDLKHKRLQLNQKMGQKVASGCISCNFDCLNKTEVRLDQSLKELNSTRWLTNRHKQKSLLRNSIYQIQQAVKKAKELMQDASDDGSVIEFDITQIYDFTDQHSQKSLTELGLSRKSDVLREIQNLTPEKSLSKSQPKAPRKTKKRLY